MITEVENVIDDLLSAGLVIDTLKWHVMFVS